MIRLGRLSTRLSATRITSFVVESTQSWSSIDCCDMGKHVNSHTDHPSFPQGEIISCRFDSTGERIAAASADRCICMFLSLPTVLLLTAPQPFGKHIRHTTTTASSRWCINKPSPTSPFPRPTLPSFTRSAPTACSSPRTSTPRNASSATRRITDPSTRLLSLAPAHRLDESCCSRVEMMESHGCGIRQGKERIPSLSWMMG